MGIVTMILNDAPYGIEKAYTALRLASALVVAGEKLYIHLMGDAVVAAKAGQKTPDGYYNLGDKLKDLLLKGVIIKVCQTCIKARGIAAEEMIEGIQVGSMIELAKTIRESDKVLTF